MLGAIKHMIERQSGKNGEIMIYIVRHGQTDLNKQVILQGRNGLPLNEIGINQAMKIAKNLENTRFDYVFSSPQERAIQTAMLITGKEPIIDNRIDVFDLGEADGIKRESAVLVNGVPCSNTYKNVENPKALLKRVMDFMSEVESTYGNKECNILIVGHRCTTGCMGAYFEGIPSDGNVLKYSSNTGEFKIYEFKKTI